MVVQVSIETYMKTGRGYGWVKFEGRRSSDLMSDSITGRKFEGVM